MAQSDQMKRFQGDLLAWADGNTRDFPWRKHTSTPYEILLAEIFLKQTRAQTVGAILPEFIEQFPSPSSIRQASKDEIIDVIRPLGIYNYRAEALKEIADHLQTASVPDSEEKLLNLPQVGPYVANATLCFGFSQPRPIVDSNIRRVYGRVFEETQNMAEDALWRFAEAMVPRDGDLAQQYNYGLLDFGAAICIDSSPRCESCFANAYCNYYQKSRQS